MNVYFLGYLSSAYRSEGYVKALIDNDIKNLYISNYNKKGKGILKKIADLLMLLKSDIVFIPPLQHNNRFMKLIIFLKKKYIVDFYISFYDSNVFDYNHFSEKSMQAQKLKREDITVLRNAQLSIFLNNSERDFYLKRLGLNQNEVVTKVIPLYNPEKKAIAKLKYFNKETNKMRICWTGTYIPLHGLDKILEAVFIFKKKYGQDKIELILWGDSDKKAQSYKEIVNSLNLEKDVVFLNKFWGNIEKWSEYMIDNCDVSLGVFGDSMKSKTVLPNKVLDGIALRTPVLTQNSKGINEFGLDKYLYTVENTPSEIADMIFHIFNSNKKEILDNLEGSYDIYQNNFTYDVFEQNVGRVIVPYLKEDDKYE